MLYGYLWLVHNWWTKSDIGEKQVNMEDIAKLKEYLKCEYFETSSKNGDGVDDLFFFLAKRNCMSE